MRVGNLALAFVTAGTLAMSCARADGEIVIELKGVPAPRPPELAAAGQPNSAQTPDSPRVTSMQHIAVARRSPGGPPQLPPATQQGDYGQLAVTLANDNPIFRKPDVRSQILSRPAANQYLVIRKPLEGWFEILMRDGSAGYIPAHFIELLNYRVTDVDARGRGPYAAPTPVAGGGKFAQTLLTEAYRYMGTRYVWGGNDERGIDCSGLVKKCFGTCGVKLPRRASEQAMVGAPIEFPYLEPGDRLYFSVKKQYDHTGIYVGNGYFIHSSRSRGGVSVDHLSRPLYSKSLSAARR